jgi:hypothetical protein
MTAVNTSKQMVHTECQQNARGSVRHKSDNSSIIINDSPVAIVSQYKYLGCVVDNKLSFEDHVITHVKKANKQLYFVRVMNNIQVDRNIVTLFYNSTISSVLTYSSTASTLATQQQTPGALRTDKSIQ